MLFKKKKKLSAHEQEMLGAGLNADRTIRVGTGFDADMHYFMVDGDAKKFASYHKKTGLKVFNFDQLVDFEVQEDGNTITQGNGAKTLAGGLAFGAVGALAGAVSDKKTKTVCEQLCVRIKLNDLQTPLLSYPLIITKTKKNSMHYQMAADQVAELSATLEYIENNK